MKMLRFSRTGLIGLLVGIGLLFSATSSFAVGAGDGTLTATVTLQRATLTFTAGSPLLITINPPTTGSADFDLDFLGNCIITPAGGGASCSGSVGDFTLSGQNNSNVLIGATFPACTGAGPTQGSLTMDNIQFKSVNGGTYGPGNHLLAEDTAGSGTETPDWIATINASSDATGFDTCTAAFTSVYSP